MWIALIIVGGVLLLLAMIVVVSRLALAAMRGPLEKRATRRYPTGILASEYGANNMGWASKGKLQVRGNGALVLTATELTFFQLVPETEVVIPLPSIVETSFGRTHLGKATPFKLLKIRFVADGKEDCVAFMLRKPAEFREKVETARKPLAIAFVSTP